jgi:hypothetical protein
MGETAGWGLRASRFFCYFDGAGCVFGFGFGGLPVLPSSSKITCQRGGFSSAILGPQLPESYISHISILSLLVVLIFA